MRYFWSEKTQGNIILYFGALILLFYDIECITIIVTTDENLKNSDDYSFITKNFLEALEHALGAEGNSTIQFFDEKYNLDEETISNFLEKRANRSLVFEKAKTEKMTTITLKGDLTKKTKLVFYDRLINLILNGISLQVDRIYFLFTEKINEDFKYSCFFCAFGDGKTLAELILKESTITYNQTTFSFIENKNLTFILIHVSDFLVYLENVNITLNGVCMFENFLNVKSTNNLLEPAAISQKNSLINFRIITIEAWHAPFPLIFQMENSIVEFQSLIVKNLIPFKFLMNQIDIIINNTTFLIIHCSSTIMNWQGTLSFMETVNSSLSIKNSRIIGDISSCNIISVGEENLIFLNARELNEISLYSIEFSQIYIKDVKKSTFITYASSKSKTKSFKSKLLVTGIFYKFPDSISLDFGA